MVNCHLLTPGITYVVGLKFSNGQGWEYLKKFYEGKLTALPLKFFKNLIPQCSPKAPQFMK